MTTDILIGLRMQNSLPWYCSEDPRSIIVRGNASHDCRKVRSGLSHRSPIDPIESIERRTSSGEAEAVDGSSPVISPKKGFLVTNFLIQFLVVFVMS